MEIEEIAHEIVDCGYKLHTDLGPGLLESVYEVVLSKMIEQRGLAVERQKPVPICYASLRFKEGIKRIVNNHHQFAASRLRVHQENK